MIKFAAILLRVVKEGDGRIASQVVDCMSDPSFDMNIFQRCVKNLPGCKDVTYRNKGEPINHNKLHKVLERGRNVKKDGCGILTVR